MVNVLAAEMNGAAGFGTDELRERARDGLLRQAPALDGSAPGGRSDFDLDPSRTDRFEGPPRLAAVLVPVRSYPQGASVILTERSASMPSHAGQISFPGGRIAHGEETPLEAALREAEEEIGLASAQVEVLGFLDTYLTGSGYLIAPVVAVIDGPFTPIVQEREVASVFEVPLSFLMDPDNHATEEREIRGRLRRYYAMTYGERYIWGATAAMLKNMYDRIYR